ncbi:GyrI-like domain-containing protein [Halalkalibacter sp. APA_J-10(15)]|uniref:GyrI-like domain-containing protein n=1 Tax=unclassified Halalkalibacter TaxID=2893063 RepID=UPI001FF39BDA|nr:GyrI-like domain-containing protein [Halalkalibacter sp. APA_J-10(15)]MCK0470963.1 GyrI-like domain-containing protein [Halalkalibacter sp. APA_J-10(15)]
MRRVELDSFYFAGVGTKTSNEKELTAEGVIPKMWEQFYQQSISEMIENKKDNTVLALYSDYESDVSGAYFFRIGHQLQSRSDQKEGVVLKEIPAAEYIIFTSKKGPISEVVPQLWQEIWNYFSTSIEIRSYSGDFEIYDERAGNPNEAIVDIYIAIEGR